MLATLGTKQKVNNMNVALAIIALIIEFVIAVSCYKLAVKKGRNPIMWFVLGIFFPIPALIVLLLLKPSKEAEYINDNETPAV